MFFIAPFLGSVEYDQPFFFSQLRFEGSQCMDSLCLPPLYQGRLRALKMF